MATPPAVNFSPWTSEAITFLLPAETTSRYLMILYCITPGVELNDVVAGVEVLGCEGGIRTHRPLERDFTVGVKNRHVH